jgi:DNA processing protein
MNESIKAIVTLSALNISGRLWDQILWHGGAEQILLRKPEIIFSLLLNKSKQIPFLNEDIFKILKKAQEKAQGVSTFLKSGGHILGALGPHELGKLNRASSPLLCAYLRGNRELVRTIPTIAIIGTRDPSIRGQERAFDIAHTLSSAGCLIASGGANGIDMAAHEGALTAGGETLVVLADPLTVRQDERPMRIRNLKPAEKVSTLCVFGPWVGVNRSLFVSRNQYIAALADAILIVEGKLDSGTLHTARFARRIGVPVWVIPGDPDNPLAGAANLLLQEGEAKAFIQPEHLLKNLGVSAIKSKIDAQIFHETKKIEIKTITGMYTDLITIFSENGGRTTLDFLCDQIGKPISLLQKDLLELELLGTIRKDGAEFVLTEV